MSKLVAISYPTGYRKSTEVKLCNTVVPDAEGAIALDLMHHLAIAAATDGGEDSAGRHKIRLMTPRRSSSARLRHRSHRLE
jgi:hypothetical protein